MMKRYAYLVYRFCPTVVGMEHLTSNRIDRVIITGGSSGIGYGAAQAFLAEGARVVLGGRDPDKLERVRAELGDGVATVAGAIGEPATAERLAAVARQHMGGVDVLINNAGIFGMKPFLESTVEELDAFYTTNLRGTFLVTRALVPLMIEGGGGSITNVGTVLVDQAGAAFTAAAAVATKGGVHALTRSLALELAPHRVRVNAIAPGIIRTPLIGPNAEALAGLHPLGRVGEVQDTAQALLYLARASFVSGVVLPVDGGYSHGR